MNLSMQFKRERKESIKRILTVWILLILSSNLFSISAWNYISRCFCVSCEGTVIPKQSNFNKPIENYVIEGAGYFFNSFSDMMLFSNRYELMELNGLDFYELNTILDNAISNMEKSRLSYWNFIIQTESIPYNQSSIEFLKKFNYAEYANRNHVNQLIFNEVVSYLKKGKIIELNKTIYQKISSIENKLKSMKADIQQFKIPKPKQLMELNEMFAKNLIAGQYGAAIFALIQ